MKKVLLTAVAVFSLTFVNAQEEKETSAYKPTKGTVTTEVALVGGVVGGFDLDTGALKFRYFLKDDMALRLGLGLNSNKTTTSDNSIPTDVFTTISKNSTTMLNLGIEKHFAGSERLSTYVGADLLLQFKGASYEESSNGYSYTEDANDTYGNSAAGNFASTSFGLGLVTGADYYITKKVYLGVEAGFNVMSEKFKDNTISETALPNVSIDGSKSSSISTKIVGGVRIGFQF